MSYYALKLSDHLRALRLHRDRWGWPAIAKELGIPVNRLRRAVDPEFAERRADIIAKSRRKSRERAELMREVSANRKAAGADRVDRRGDIPPHVLAERDWRLGQPHNDLTAELFGDPRPGQSALDKR